MYNRIFKDNDNKINYYDSIFKFFIQLNTKDRIPTDDEFRNSLINSNLYQKKNVCKLILTMIENGNSNETVEVKNLTIEHVLPQTLNAIWRSELGENADDTWSKYVHTLGNLTITGYNSELGQKCFNDKKAIISNHSKAIILNEDILKSVKWTEHEITNRADKLASKVIEMYHLDNFEVLVEQTNQNQRFYTLNDKDDLKSTRPTSFIFMGDKFYVKSYKQMTKTVLENLYRLDDDILHKLAEENFSAFGTRCAVTYDVNKLRSFQEIHDSGIYVETNLSTPYQLLLIEKILQEYGLEDEEFIIDVIDTVEDEI